MSKSFRPIVSASVKAKIKELSKPDLNAKYIFNQNPRNLERLRLAYKPEGYHLDKPGRSFWHKLELNVSQRFVTANLRHFENGIILSASTSENAIRQQLNKTRDTSAFINLARVFAQRCHEAGLIEMRCDIESVPNGKTDKFLKTLEENGILLTEAEPKKPLHRWDIVTDQQYERIMGKMNNFLKDVQEVKEVLEQIVAPSQRSNINIIPEHITVLRGTKSKKQLCRKKHNKKSSTLTRKEYAKLGLFNLPTKSIKYTEAEQLHELWKGYMKENLSITDDMKIPEVYDNGYDAFSKLIMKSDLHGGKISIIKSKCPNFVGIKGIVVLDTKNTLKIVGEDNKLRTIPKKDCIFKMELFRLVFTIFGKHLTTRPAERSVKKMKNFIEPDL